MNHSLYYSQGQSREESMNMKYICICNIPDNPCQFLDADHQCNGTDTDCSFRKSDISNIQVLQQKNNYVRQPRWYEQYYKRETKDTNDKKKYTNEEEYLKYWEMV